MNSNLWLLAFIPILAWYLARRRFVRALKDAEMELEFSPSGLTQEEMGDYVKDLSTNLQPPTRVHSPNLGMDTSHIWNSPSGKRVYMN